MIEEYDEYGEIKPVYMKEYRLTIDQQHRIHETKDIFDGECSLCQLAAKKHIRTYWSDDA